jgi:hypothetical protein
MRQSRPGYEVYRRRADSLVPLGALTCALRHAVRG